MRSNGTPYNKLNQNLKRLGWTMLGGAVYDLIVGLAGLLFSSQIANWAQLPTPPSMSYFFWPLIHFIFPCFCILAWMDTKRNIVIVTGAMMARVLYALFMFFLVFISKAHLVWAIVGGISLLLAFIHYIFLRLSDFGFWEVLSRAGNPPGVRRR